MKSSKLEYGIEKHYTPSTFLCDTFWFVSQWLCISMTIFIVHWATEKTTILKAQNEAVKHHAGEYDENNNFKWRQIRSWLVENK